MTVTGRQTAALFFRPGGRNGLLCCRGNNWRGVDFIPLTIMKKLIFLFLLIISQCCFSAGGGTGAGAYTRVEHKSFSAYTDYLRQKYGVDFYSAYSYLMPYGKWRYISSGSCPTASYSPSEVNAERCLAGTAYLEEATGVTVYEYHVLVCGAIGDGWSADGDSCYRDCSVMAGGLIEPYLYQTNAWSICDQETTTCLTGTAWPSGSTDYRCEDGCRVLVDLTDAGKNLFGGCSHSPGSSKDNPVPLFCYVKQAGYTGATCSLSDTPKKPTSGTTQSGESWSSSTTGSGTGGETGGTTGDGGSTSGGSPSPGTGTGTGTNPGTGTGDGDGTGTGTGTGSGTGTGDGYSLYGQNKCADAFLCSGDAVQCGVAREAWMARCIAEQVNSLEGNDNSVFDPNKPFGTDDFKQKGDDALNKNGLFDFDVMEAFQKNRQEYFSFAAGCISSVPVNIYGNLLTIDLSILCELGKFIRLIMHIAAYLIVLRLMHRTLV